MKLPRNITRVICGFVISMLLFTQAAFAASPCIDPAMSAAAAVSQSGEHDCCDASDDTTNLCVAMCVDGDRTSAHPDVALPALGEPPVVALVFVPGPAAGTRLRHVAARPPPPKTIRFCSLLI